MSYRNESNENDGGATPISSSSAAVGDIFPVFDLRPRLKLVSFLRHFNFVAEGTLHVWE